MRSKYKILSNTFNVTFLLILSFGFFILLIINKGGTLFDVFYSENDKKSSILIATIITLIFLAAFISFVAKYLAPTDLNNIELQKKSIVKSETEIQKKIASDISKFLQQNPELVDIEKSVYNKVIANLEYSIIKKISDRFRVDIKSEFISNTIISEVLPLTEDTKNYIDTIQRNSIVNLMIGIIGTIGSISILAFSIFSANNFSEFNDFLLHFLPRITFAIFIQLFAFFFLRLYKNNLEDAKYFQNELTNLSAITSSLKIAHLTENEDLKQQIILNLSITERNFKLANNETLLNIEKAKIEKEVDLETYTAFKEFLKTYKKD